MLRIALFALLAACSRVDDPKDGDDTADTDAPDTAGGDEDGDGYKPSDGDCNDGDATVFPGAEEACNGVDDDCDDTIDEDVIGVYYLDADGDGHGGDVVAVGCEAPAGYVDTSEDCDDGDAAVFPDAEELCNGVDDDCDGAADEELEQAYWLDADGDGHGDADAPIFACEAPAGAADTNDDCDDGDARIHPGAEETDCEDPVDYNCDGSVGYADADGDGFAACAECDDGNAAISPDGVESCNDADDDCDGEIDEAGSVGETTWYTDADGDGYGDAATPVSACDAGDGIVADASDCDDTTAAVSPAAEETCNEIDDDCDGVVDDAEGAAWYADVDGDGFGDADAVTYACEQPAGTVADATDCDDAVATTAPGASETCNDVDDDCDGVVDDNAIDQASWYYDADGDGYGNAAAWTSACDQPAGYVDNAEDCNDGAATASPAGAETCDGLDNDCDGTVDEEGTSLWYADADGDGYGDLSRSVYACSAPAGYVASSADCDDTTASVSPAAAEVCDAVDNDCDGDVDETGSITFYADADGDGYGDPTSVVAGCSVPTGYTTNDDDCDDTLASTNPAGTETCDGTDEDCDGAIDDNTGSTWYVDADGDGYGSASSTTVSCTMPSGYADNDDDCLDSSSSYSPGAAEVCDDGLDQDCDGTADDGCPDVVEHCGTISSSETWSGEDIHVVTCDVYVQGSSSPLLTIEDGARVEFDAGTAIYVGWSSYGELWVDGHTDGVTLTSGQTRQRAGDWEGLNFGTYDRGSWLEGATIEYGGYNGAGNVYVVNSNLVTLLNSVVTNSSESGVYVQNATVEVAGTTMSDNADYGLYLTTNADLYTLGGQTFTGNTLSGNGLYPMTLPAAYLSEIAGDNSLAGNTYDALYVYTGTLATTTTLPALDVPYYVSGDISVGTAMGMTLTVSDGVVMEFASGAGLTIGSSYVDFLVDGHTTGVTFTSARSSPSPGDWDGLTFTTYTDSALLDGATIAYGGDNGYGNVYVYQADVEITNSTITDSDTNGVYVSWYGTADIQDSVIRDNTDYGLYVYTYGELAGDGSIDGNTITANDVGVYVQASDIGALGSAGTYAGNVSGDVQVAGDTVATSSTMRALDVYWHILGDVTVAGASRPVLTVEDGVEARFATGSGLIVGSGSYGGLDVQGSTAGVTFTSADATPAAGDWDGVMFTWYALDSTLSGCDIGYGGANGYANVYLNYSGYSSSAGAIAIDGCTLHDSSESGVYINASDELAITDTTIADNTDHGVFVASGSALETVGEPSFSGNTVTGNGLYPVYLPATSMDQLSDDGTYTGNGIDRIYVLGDTVTASGTWRNLDVPWLVMGDIGVYNAASPVITIAPGTTMLFNTLTGLFFGQFNYGTLVAEGTAAEPIVFTSAQSSPSPGDWDGIALYTYDTGSSLAYVEVSYGGSGLSGNLYIASNGSRVSVSNSTMAYSDEYGIYRAGGATPTLTSITYTSNTSGTLY